MTPADLLSTLTAIWLLGWAIAGAVLLGQRQRHSVLFLLLTHFGLCGLPLIVDLVVGPPSYSFLPGFYTASRDTTTRMLFCAYVALTPVVLYLFGRASASRHDEAAVSAPRVNRRTRRMLGIAVAMPVGAALLAPDSSIYLSYGAQLQVLGDLEQYHAFVNALCLLSIVSGVSLLLTAEKLSFRSFAFITPWLFASCWLVGKRFILALVVLGVLYVMWSRSALGARRFGFAVIVSGLCIGVASFVYQRTVREMSPRESDLYYTGVRVDFGRDPGIMQAIRAELDGPENRILEFRGESLLFNLAMFVPRTVWPTKPWPYAVYDTARALGLNRASSIGWGVTTSWLGESIANFGWAGFLLGPLALALLCRVGDGTGDPVVRYMTVNVGSLLMAVQLAAFWPVAVIWFAFCLRHYSGIAARHVHHVLVPRTSPVRLPISIRAANQR